MTMNIYPLYVSEYESELDELDSINAAQKKAAEENAAALRQAIEIPESKSDRISLLKCMHADMCSMNNTDAYACWIAYGVPDCPSAEDYEWIADEEDAPGEIRGIIDVYCDLRAKYDQDGFYPRDRKSAVESFLAEQAKTSAQSGYIAETTTMRVWADSNGVPQVSFRRNADAPWFTIPYSDLGGERRREVDSLLAESDVTIIA